MVPALDRVRGVRAAAAGRERREDVLDRHSAAERHRLPAHGPCAQQHAAGRAGALPPHARRGRRCGCPAPTTPASRRRTSSSGSSRPRAPTATRSAARRSSSAPGSGRPSPAARSPSSCGGSACPATGRASASRWTRGCRAPCARSSSRSTKKGLIHRDRYLINWCPRCRTALSDIEVEHEDRAGHLWHLRYPLEDGSGFISVATTRPETMLGDTAVAVHPGRRALPGPGRQERRSCRSSDRAIPVIADAYVDSAFGSGAVKITPAHDPNDFEIGLRHSLPMISVMNEDGDDVGRGRRRTPGMTTAECRAALVERFDADGVLERIEDHRHAVGICYRCRNVVEPLLSDQWFVRGARAGRRDARGARRRPHALRAGALGEDLPRVDGEHPPLVHLAPAVVGAPHPGLVLRRLRAPRRLAHRPHRVPEVRRRRAPGRGRARHLVLVGPVAVLDDGLAGEDRRPRALLSDHRAGDRLRHHLLLGGAHDDDGPAASWARCRSATSTSTPSCATSTGRRCPSRRAT